MLKGAKKNSTNKVREQARERANKKPELNVTEKNPQHIRQTQQTISPKFSQGAPDPANPRVKTKGTHVSAVANALKTEKISYKDFPPLEVFEIVDPDEGSPLIFLLSNRRLTAFKESGIDKINTRPATFDEICDSEWKMTSRDGGESKPSATSFSSQREALPEAWSTLGKFRRDMESERGNFTQRFQAQGITGAAAEPLIREKVQQQMVAKYKLH